MDFSWCQCRAKTNVDGPPAQLHTSKPLMLPSKATLWKPTVWTCELCGNGWQILLVCCKQGRSRGLVRVVAASRASSEAVRSLNPAFLPCTGPGSSERYATASAAPLSGLQPAVPTSKPQLGRTRKFDFSEHHNTVLPQDERCCGQCESAAT